MPVRSNIFDNSCYLPVHAETRRRGGFMVVDDATDVFLERGAPEVDEKTDGLASKTKIGQQLLAMSRVQPFDGFDLHQQTAIDEQINTKSCIEARTFEMYIDRHLDRKSTRLNYSH